jgi:hypothetical protein
MPEKKVARYIVNETAQQQKFPFSVRACNNNLLHYFCPAIRV